jgi:hypothetical protein
MDFERDIQPIFAARCLSCHVAGKEKGGLRLDDGAEAMLGGNSGTVIVPGKSADSRLIHVVAGTDPDTRMPPKGPLSAAEVGKLRAWIDQGARWPRQATATTMTKRSDHWAFQPIRRPELPRVRQADWPRNGIDYFILARLEKEGIAPSPQADRVTLVRRLHLDLLGLPPPIDAIEQVLADQSDDWYERLVERLLSSPHYGERWGRHWLDLARYADSDGYEKDTGRPFAWRWRHWVIDALNRDLPFDQFTIEQLAGDLLPNATLEQKIATGFHRNTLTNKEGGVDREQFRVEACVDRVNTTGKVWLGITLGCAQCHDHKYDPFTQKEYYQFFAFFNSDNEVDLPAPLPAEEEAYNRQKADFDRKKAELQGALADYRQALPAKWEADFRLPELRRLPADIRVILLSEPKERSEAQVKQLAQFDPQRSADQWEADFRLAEWRKLPAGVRAALLQEPGQRDPKQLKELNDYFAKVDSRLVLLTKAVTDHEKTAPKQPVAQTLALGPSRKTHVMIRGDFLRPGAAVEPGMPGVLSPQVATPGRERLTRLDLAKWLVHPANPLTARVTVNWMWHKYFGRGIVPTLEDFGTQGERPTHPELLDWLASEFMAPTRPPRGTASAWSLKAMHRLIVNSATYRQSSRARPELRTRDPLNVLLYRQNRLRLEAEIIRDVALTASGLLTRTIGGPSVRPPQRAGIAELTYANSARWVESTGPDRYRRGMYTWFQRTSPYPMLMTFDAPDAVISCVRRERTNTPLQALTLLNDTVFVECFQALGMRILTEKTADVGERLRHGFQLCLAREPTAAELAVLRRLFDDLLALGQSQPEETAKLLGKARPPADVASAEAAAWVAVARALLNLDEVVTRE